MQLYLGEKRKLFLGENSVIIVTISIKYGVSAIGTVSWQHVYLCVARFFPL